MFGILGFMQNLDISIKVSHVIHISHVKKRVAFFCSFAFYSYYLKLAFIYKNFLINANKN